LKYPWKETVQVATSRLTSSWMDVMAELCPAGPLGNSLILLESGSRMAETQRHLMLSSRRAGEAPVQLQLMTLRRVTELVPSVQTMLEISTSGAAVVKVVVAISERMPLAVTPWTVMVYVVLGVSLEMRPDVVVVVRVLVGQGGEAQVCAVMVTMNET